MARREDTEPSSVDFQRMSKRRHLWIIVAVAVLVVVAGVTVVALRIIDAEQRAALNRSWSELNTCLLGSPLAPGEEPGRRVRNIQLAQMGIHPAKRAAFGEYAWPATCATKAHAVAEVLRGQGSDAPLGESAERLAKLLKDEKSHVADLDKPVTDVWQHAASLSLEQVPVGEVKPPPEPMKPWSEADLPKTSRLMTDTFNTANIRYALNAEPELRFLVDDPDVPGGPAHCRTSREDKTIRCAYVPDAAEKLSPGLRLWGTHEDGAETVIFAGDRGTSGIFSTASGKQRAATLTYGATARKDGALDLLTWNDEAEEVRWLHVGSDGTPKETSLLDRKDIGNPYYTVTLLWGWVVYKTFVDGAEGLRWMTRKLPAPGGAIPPAADAGRVFEHAQVRGYDDRPHMRACRTDKAIAAVIDGTVHDSVSFLIDGKWSTPVPATHSGGVLTCRNAEATTTRVRHVMKGKRNLPTIMQSRCSVASCEAASVDLEKVLEGVEELASPNAEVISTLLSFEVVPGDRFALVFLRTMNEGVRVLRIEADGSYGPATVEMRE